MVHTLVGREYGSEYAIAARNRRNRRNLMSKVFLVWKDTYCHRKDLFPPRMLLYQLPFRNLPRFADDMRDLVEVESWVYF